MSFARRPLGSDSRFLLALLLALSSVASFAAEKPRIEVNDYVINAELVPNTHRLVARARVKFTALEDISIAVFELHNALRPTRVLDAEGHTLSAERVTQDSTVRVALPNGLNKGQSTELTFDYDGRLQSADESPVEGLKLASVNDDISYLLYAGRWFPMSGYGINRFTANISVIVPSGYTVIGSGRMTVGPAKSEVVGSGPDSASDRRGRPAPPKPATAARSEAGKTMYSFVWDRPSFPGTIIAGRFSPGMQTRGGLTIRTFFKPNHKGQETAYADTSAQEYEFFSSIYGPAPSRTINLVELPDDTVPSAWAPEIVALAARAIQEKTNYRLLANTLAHQWWGVSVAPATRNDFWLCDGFARYSEARYVEQAAGQGGYEEVTKDMSVGALAYDTVPLSSIGKLDPFSPEFQSETTDKGAMILHMLRWVIGDEAFDKAMKGFAQQYAGKTATADDFRKMAEFVYGENLTSFFSQWLDSTGAPEFKNKYTVYRTPKGFRVVGEITQDLDLFRMPVELRIDTDGKPEAKRIEVVGTDSPYVVETFGKPRRISIDPGNDVLKNSSELRVRANILRGQSLVQQGDLAGALREFQKALESNRNSSLAHYRIAEVFFLQRNYQAAANSYREALNGNGEPRWVEVWSHIQLGKIFDSTGQRERATNEYRQALATNDNTQGAQEEARKYLQAPYSREKDKG
ncbi:MAG: tetratricopeptide repeat protein [Acidobacteriia bacterium]|nr:tetratricopeptide repeat protein [Terriglobia bacterium]